MFEVGFTEIILILGLALLVLGPEKLPALAEKVGRWTGRARAMARQLRTQLEHEVTMDELTRSRPMQAPPNPEPPPTAAPAAESQAAAEAAAATADASMPPHPGQGLDFDTMVSGIEPPADPLPAAPETPTPKPAQ